MKKFTNMEKLIKKFTDTIFDLSIKKKMQLSFLVISIVPLFILGSYAYQKTVDVIEVLASRYAVSLIQEIEYSVTDNFYEIDELSKLIVDTKSIISILTISKEAYIEDKQKNAAAVKTSLTPFILNNSYIKNIYILPENYDASYRALYNDEALYKEDPETGLVGYQDEEKYTATKDAYNNNQWWIEDIGGDEKVGFILTRKIYDAQYGFLGVLVIEISSNIMENAERISASFAESDFFILNENNQVVYNDYVEVDGNRINGIQVDQSFFDKVKGSYISNDRVETATVVVYSLFLSSDWKLILFVPYSELIKEVDAIRYVVISMVIVIAFLAIYLSVRVSSSIYNPLKKIMEKMSIASKGDVSVRVDVQHKDDIGALGESFNNLMSDMEKLIESVKYEQEEKAKMHIQMLEYQMNPHFLYNTFATMYWMAMEDGNYKLAQLANSLSNYYKLGLNHGEEVTTVGDEVRHVEEYLIIQRERSSKSFDYVIEVDQEIKSYKTIKILLQPLVENSIMHGFKNSSNPHKMIKIKVSLEGEMLKYMVEDNGKGLDDPGEKGIDYFIDRGIGVGNAIKRLRLSYNEKFTFTCKSVPNKQTVFTIAVPVIKT